MCLLQQVLLTVTGCGGGKTSFSPPPINLSVSVNNATITVPPNNMAVNVPVTIVAPTETATFTIAGLPAGSVVQLQGIGIQPFRITHPDRDPLNDARHLYAADYRRYIRSNRFGGFYPGGACPGQASPLIRNRRLVPVISSEGSFCRPPYELGSGWPRSRF